MTAGGSADLTGALASRYPHLTGIQRDRLQAAILRELAAAIAQGHGIGVIRPLPDGSFEISRFAVEHAGPAAG